MLLTKNSDIYENLKNENYGFYDISCYVKVLVTTFHNVIKFKV